jgi:hypothetical protein
MKPAKGLHSCLISVGGTLSDPLYSDISTEDMISKFIQPKQHQCKMCSASFAFASGLSRHMRACHAGVHTQDDVVQHDTPNVVNISLTGNNNTIHNHVTNNISTVVNNCNRNCYYPCSGRLDITLVTHTSVWDTRQSMWHCTAMLELHGPCDVGGLQQLTLGLKLIIG